LRLYTEAGDGGGGGGIAADEDMSEAELEQMFGQAQLEVENLERRLAAKKQAQQAPK